jgi:hypothetical protein
VTLELTGPAGGSWLIGAGDAIAVVRIEAMVYIRTLAGRENSPALELVSGPDSALPLLCQARVAF